MYRKYVWVTLNIKLFGSYIVYEQKYWGYYTLHIQELLIRENQCNEFPSVQFFVPMLMQEEVWSSAAVESAAQYALHTIWNFVSGLLWLLNASTLQQYHSHLMVEYLVEKYWFVAAVVSYYSTMLKFSALFSTRHSFTNVCEAQMRAEVHRCGHVTENTWILRLSGVVQDLFCDATLLHVLQAALCFHYIISKVSYFFISFSKNNNNYNKTGAYLT